MKFNKLFNFRLIDEKEIFEKSRMESRNLFKLKDYKNDYFGLTFNEYHSYSEIQTFMNRIVWALPDRAKLFTIGKSVEGRDIQGIYV